MTLLLEFLENGHPIILKPKRTICPLMTQALDEAPPSPCHRTSKMPTGTKEWADSNINIINGCHNDCRYCYAKKMAIRFKRKTAQNWKEMELNPNAIKSRYLKRTGRIMFPSSHDITPEFLDPCLQTLRKLLEAGNSVLITSKPSLQCIQAICDKLQDFKEFIQFRFTIGSNDDRLLGFWEPNAPRFSERFEALKYAFHQGFKTSISIEPFLDPDPKLLVEMLDPYVTESIWVGKMNYLSLKGLNEDEKQYYLAIREQSLPKNIKKIYNSLKIHPKIQWKDSIKKILSIEK